MSLDVARTACLSTRLTCAQFALLSMEAAPREEGTSHPDWATEIIVSERQVLSRQEARHHSTLLVCQGKSMGLTIE